MAKANEIRYDEENLDEEVGATPSAAAAERSR